MQLACAAALLLPCAAFLLAPCALPAQIAPQTPGPYQAVQHKRAVTLFFVGHDCPISNGYAPEIARICREYGAQQIGFYMVYPDAGLTLAAARKHAREYGFTAPVVLDAAHRLCRKTGASVTPEAVVLGPKGNVLYRGRIDDLYAGLGKRRWQATRHDLRLALNAVAHNQPVPLPTTTQAIGCFIPDLNLSAPRVKTARSSR